MPPAALRSAAYYGARKLGRGVGYIYPHGDEAGFEVDCLPEELIGRRYYEPSGVGEELAVERSARAEPETPGAGRG